MTAVRGYVARGICTCSRSCYLMGCRNEPCREEHRRYVTRTRQVTRTPHGRRARYDAGCRCALCSQARAAAYKAETLRALQRTAAALRKGAAA